MINVFDRVYIDYENFDEYCEKGMRFVFRLKENAIIKILEENFVEEDSPIEVKRTWERINMRITVADLLNMESFKGFRLAAGDMGLNRAVDDVSVMEVPDIEDYVKKGDFLLSTFYPIYNDDEALEQIIPKLQGLGLSGLGIKLNRYIESIPQYIIDQANKLDFPLVILPERSNFSVQINEFLKEKISLHNQALEHRNSIHNTLMELMLKGHEYDELSSSLAAELGHNVMLLDSSFERLGNYSIDQECKLDVETVKNKKYLVVNTPWDEKYVMIKFEQICASFFVVQHGFSKLGFIVIYSTENLEFNEMESITIEQYAIVFSIIIHRKRAMIELERRYIDEFTYDLIFGKIGNESHAIDRAKALGWNLSFPIGLLVIDIYDSHRKVMDRAEILSALKIQFRDAGAMAPKKWNAFFANTGEYFIVLLNDVGMASLNKIIKNMENALNRNALNDFHIGISRMASGVVELVKCYQEGREAVEIAKLLDKRVLHFKDIGIYRILHNAGNREEMMEYCLETLGSIIEYDKKHNSNLLETLNNILTASGNLKEAAKKMFIHYNTIRYRFKNIEQLLGRNLDCIDSYQDVYFALKIYNTIKKRQQR